MCFLNEQWTEEYEKGSKVDQTHKWTSQQNLCNQKIFFVVRGTLYAAFHEEVFLKQIVKQRSLGAMILSIVFQQATA